MSRASPAIRNLFRNTIPTVTKGKGTPCSINILKSRFVFASQWLPEEDSVTLVQASGSSLRNLPSDSWRGTSMYRFSSLTGRRNPRFESSD